MEKVENVIQTVMDGAYNAYKANPEWSLDQFYFNLAPIERRAVALGNLNYQVNNGGFMQWIDNGYAEASRSALRVILGEIEGEAGYEQLRKALKLALAAPTSGNDSYYDYDAADESYYALTDLVEEMNHFINSFRV